MREAEVKATLLDKGFVLKKWEKPCQADLTEIIGAVKHVQQSLNDYMTQLIDCGAEDEIESSDASDTDDEAKDDRVSGFIRDMAALNNKSVGCEKRKINYLHQSKKIKK